MLAQVLGRKARELVRRGLRHAQRHDLPRVGSRKRRNVDDKAALGAKEQRHGKARGDEVRAHEMKLTKLTLDGLRDIGGITVYGPPDERARLGLVTFNVDPAVVLSSPPAAESISTSVF